MERQMLRLTFVLGILVTVLGGTGVFAVFSDQAQGGPNSVTSGSRPSAADLQIATATASSGVITCGTYSDNTTTPQFTIAGLQPTSPSTTAYVCLRNNGAGTLSLSMSAASIVDVDVDCTGDEASVDDTSCGLNAAGELSSLLYTTATEVSCFDSTPGGGDSDVLPNIVGSPLEFAAPLGASRYTCVALAILYLPSATETQIQAAQSDRVTWNFVFTGTAS